MPVYIDPSRGVNGAGTLADPRNTWAGVTWTAGETYLQRRGTTFAGRINVTSGGSSDSARVTLGVYDPATGAEVVGLGLAIVQANGDRSAPAINAAVSWVTIRSLDARNAGAGQPLILNGDNGGSNDGAVVEFCRANDSGSDAITLFSGSGTVGVRVSDCEALRATGAGCVLTGNSSVYPNPVIERNNFSFNATSGFWFIPYDADMGITGLRGRLEGNVCNDNGVYGVRVTGTVPGALQIRRNVCMRNGSIGINVEVYPTGSQVSNTTIAQNVCNSNKRFGVSIVQATGWQVVGNTCSLNGDSALPRYGRGIEITGASGRLAAGLVLDNDCHGNLNYGGAGVEPLGNGTEGVGIGVDDFCGNVQVRRNRCFQNEGNGIQYNPNGAGGAVLIESNLLIDNFKVPAARAADANWQATSHIFGQITMGDTAADTTVRNNTIINTGVATCWYGVSENNGAAGSGCSVRNNVIVGHAVGLKVRDAITRTHNAFWRAARNVESNGDTVALSNGTGAVTADPLLSPSWAPSSGSPLLGNGADLGPVRDVERRQARRVIGALAPATLR